MYVGLDKLLENSENIQNKKYICTSKLRKECNLLEMSIG